MCGRKRRDQVGKGESIGRDDWSRYAFTGECENLVYWQFPGFYEDDPREYP